MNSVQTASVALVRTHALFRQVFLVDVDLANTAARRTRFLEAVQRWLAHVDQKFKPILQ